MHRQTVLELTRRLYLSVLIVILWTQTICGAEDDAVRRKLNDARGDFNRSREEIADEVERVLSKREDDLRRSGNKPLIDEIRQERELFRGHGQWPTVTSKVIEKRFDSAYKRAHAAYVQAIRSYTRGKQDEEAAMVEMELRQFMMKHHPFSFEGKWNRRHANYPPRVHTIRGRVAIGVGGVEGKWWREKGTIIVTWPNGGREELQIDFDNVNELHGKTNRKLKSVWVRRK